MRNYPTVLILSCMYISMLCAFIVLKDKFWMVIFGITLAGLVALVYLLAKKFHNLL